MLSSDRATLIVKDVVQISTPWQAAVGAVHTPLPYSTDLAAVVNALALEDGQPSAQAFQADTAVQGETQVVLSGRCGFSMQAWCEEQSPSDWAVGFGRHETLGLSSCAKQLVTCAYKG